MSRYMFAERSFDAELERLRLLERRYDRGTFDRLAQLGNLAGASCLEVGAGAGSVTRWLAEAVGPGGQVVAVDADPRFLTEPMGANVEVRRHDILTEPLDQTFDVVHARALLIHLDDPERALRHMVAVLRPGGRILLEDADMVTLVAADPVHPASSAFDRVVRANLEALEAGGSFHPSFARGLIPLIRRAGLVAYRHEATAALRWGGSAEAELMRISGEAAHRMLIEHQLLGAADLAAWHVALSDPTFPYYDALSIAVQARKP